MPKGFDFHFSHVALLKSLQIVWNEFVERKADVALIPDRVVTQLLQRHKDAVRVSPAQFRRLLRATKTPPASEKVVPLLEYALSEFSTRSQDQLQAFFDDLVGVPLIPLADGSVASFSKDATAVATPFLLGSLSVEDEAILFAEACHRFISRTISASLRTILEAATRYGLNIATIRASHLPHLITTCYPSLGILL